MPDAQTGPGSAAQPAIITDFAKLNDGTLLELFEDAKMQTIRSELLPNLMASYCLTDALSFGPYAQEVAAP
jgi:hypothetical protein